MAAPWAGHSAVAESRDDGPRLRKVFHRVVEQTVAEPRAEDRGECSVNENRLRDLCGKSFAIDEVIEEFRADQNGQRPHQPIITDVERPDAEQHRIEIPDNGKRL